MARVFLSYARDDVDKAQAIAGALGEAGPEVWWDRHINPGSRYSKEIDAALRDAQAVVVLWSQASVDSAWVQDEAGEGVETGRLVPATLDGCKPPLGFRQYQAIALDRWNGDGGEPALQQLLGAITRTAGETSAPKPQPSAAPRQESEPSLCICVLPFINMSGDAEQEYFSDGITEDVITDLSKISALGVIARNTAFTFKGQAVDVKQVAATLGVSHVLEGSVRKSGARVRITAQLIEGRNAQHLWAERYDRELTDIFEIQDEISHAIVEALQLNLLPKEKKAIVARGTTDAAAYDLYLKARQQWIDGNLGDSRRSEAVVQLCTKATAIDAGYAQAWALMALAKAELRFWHGRHEDALFAAERALSLDPQLPEAHCVKARYLEEQGDYAAARRQVETALQLDPDSWEANREAARLIFREGKIADAIPFFEKAAAAMKSDHHSASMLISCYNATGDGAGLQRAAEMAVARAERVIATDPGNGAAFASAADGLAALGQADRAKRWIKKALNVDPGNLSMRYNLACTLASVLNDSEGALEVLEPYAEGVTNRPHVRLLELDPDLASIRDCPRFQALIANAKKRVTAIEGKPPVQA